MIKVHDSSLNEFELIQVMDHLEKAGIRWADIYRGNDCIWVASGSSSCPINRYFVFREGALRNIIFD